MTPRHPVDDGDIETAEHHLRFVAKQL